MTWKGSRSMQCHMLCLAVLQAPILSLQHSNAEKHDYYTAAVVEHLPAIVHEGPTHLEIMTANLAEYKTDAEYAAQQGADIIVFPEFGLDHARLGPTSPAFRLPRTDHPVAQVIPDPKQDYVPCDEKTTPISQVLQSLSCMAKENKMYLLANVPERRPCEDDSECLSTAAVIYNTNVAFDRQGKLVARYRKYNTYLYDFAPAPEPEYISFCTDFGVCFGTITCFDIVWDVPTLPLIKDYGITDIAYPTQWVDELPFMTAPAIQQGMSWAMDINLLASEVHVPNKGAVGCGIYGGAAGVLNYTYNPGGGNEVLIAQVKKKLSGQRAETVEEGRKTACANAKMEEDRETCHADSCKTKYAQSPTSVYLRKDLHEFSSMMLDPDQQSAQLCHNQLCCQLEYDFTASAGNNFQLMSYQGTRTVANGKFGFYIETCGIVHCTGPTVDECGQLPKANSNSVFKQLHLSGNFSHYDVLPLALDESLQLITAETLHFTRKVSSEVDEVTDTTKASLEAVDQVWSLFSLALCYKHPVTMKNP